MLLGHPLPEVEESTDGLGPLGAVRKYAHD